MAGRATGRDDEHLALLVGQVELAVARDGGGSYLLIVYFGLAMVGEDPVEGVGGVGTSYLVITPSTVFDVRGVAALASDSGVRGEVAIHAEPTLGADAEILARRFAQ